METIYDIFFTMSYTLGISWYFYLVLKTLSYMFITYFMIYVLDAIQLFRVSETFDFITTANFTRLKSLVFTLVFLNLFWFFFIKFNCLIRFNWNSFILDSTNIYFALCPLLGSILMILYLFNSTINKLKL